MKKNFIYMAAVAIMLLFSWTAYAKIVFSTSVTDIAVGITNDFMALDINGNGKSEAPMQTPVTVRETLGAVDKNGVQRVTRIDTFKYLIFDPLTGRTLRTLAQTSHILRLDVPAATPFFNEQQGQGIITAGPQRYFVHMVAGTTGGIPAPLLLKGTPYSEASLSVIIYNGKTGAVVKRFTLQSNRTLQLLADECRFTDINGITYFVERYLVRGTAIPGPPPFVQRERLLVKIWNTTHTRLIRQYIKTKVVVVR